MLSLPCLLCWSLLFAFTKEGRGNDGLIPSLKPSSSLKNGNKTDDQVNPTPGDCAKKFTMTEFVVAVSVTAIGTALITAFTVAVLTTRYWNKQIIRPRIVRTYSYSPNRTSNVSSSLPDKALNVEGSTAGQFTTNGNKDVPPTGRHDARTDGINNEETRRFNDIEGDIAEKPGIYDSVASGFDLIECT
jgi:hypothetical protein